MNNKPQIERARVGQMGAYEVAVHSDDVCNAPHVHVVDKSTEAQICVRLDCAKYIVHGTKLSVFKRQDRQRFDEFMREPSRNVHYRNNYEAAVNLWNDNNSNNHLPLREDDHGDIIIPDYTTL